MQILNKEKLIQLVEKEKTGLRHTILIVDDEQGILSSTESLLSEEYNVITAKDGKEALELIQSMEKPEEISVIISDQRMPNLSGIQFLEKSMKIVPNTIRIIITGFSDSSVMLDSINKIQVFRFIEKPFESIELLVHIRNAIKEYEEKIIQKNGLKSSNKNSVFISYSHEDSGIVDRLIIDLKNINYEVWIDKKMIKCGNSISEDIEQAISFCKNFCVILSQNSIKSQWVEKECKFALKTRNKFYGNNYPRILPILLNEIEMPILLRDILYADFTWDYNKGFEQLLDAMK